MTWDIFCRVVDNHGDLGVCWRLSAQLAATGRRVRLWVDDGRALAWMAPAGCTGVEVHPWRDDTPWPTPGEVVVEAFGCDPPPAFVAAMATRWPAPVWINLEYLSAESYVERSHRLPSPQSSGPGAGLTKWFFYPGFTPATGGLLREPGLVDALDAQDGPAFLRRLGVAVQAGERCVSVFAYPQAPLAALPAALADRPTLLLATPGAATEVLTQQPLPPGVRVQALPWLAQPDYDRLLAACDLNFVRGEDSFVRAQWAGRPFVWQIYAQDDHAHAAKLDAFLSRHLHGAPPALAGAVSPWMRAWSGLAPALPPPPPLDAWQAQARRWRAQLAAQNDLLTQLLHLVAEKR